MLTEFLSAQVNLQRAASNRRNNFRGETAKISDLGAAATAVSFPALLKNPDTEMTVQKGNALDLTENALRGDAMLLVWDENQRYSKPLTQFSAKRGRHDSLLRIVLPMPKPTGLAEK
jgi:hypothetical protein